MKTRAVLLKILKRLLAASLTPIRSIGVVAGCSKANIGESVLRDLYSRPFPKKKKSLRVYHLGHSLVGRTMPLMLQQLAGTDHVFKSQLGWGTPLRDHWEPELPISGFEQENDHENYQDIFDAIRSSEFDAFILTEMVEIESAIKYFDSARYFQNFVEEIYEYNPDALVYLFESWHEVTSKKGWISRLDRDLDRYWLGQIVDKTIDRMERKKPIYLIPVGQVMSMLFKEIARLGGVEGLGKPQDIFKRNSNGSLDPIHVNDIGNYLVALVHYAVLYKSSPLGLPYQLRNETGDNAKAPSAEAARLMQEITWRVVSKNYRTGTSAC